MLKFNRWLDDMKLVEKIFNEQRSPPAVIAHICRKNTQTAGFLESSKNKIPVPDIVKSCVENLIVPKIKEELIKKPLKVCI